MNDTPTTVAAGGPAWLQSAAGADFPGTDYYDADVQLEPATIEGSATVAILRIKFYDAQAGAELTLDELYGLRAVLQGIIDEQQPAPPVPTGPDYSPALSDAEAYDLALGDPRSWE